MRKGLVPAPAVRGEIATRERCGITERLNHARAPEVSLARSRVAPGVVTERHRLSVNEWYVISDGHGMMEVGADAPFAVGPGDSVAIPAGVAQRIRNTGNGDLVFECICIPRFTPACYEALDDA